MDVLLWWCIVSKSASRSALSSCPICLPRVRGVFRGRFPKTPPRLADHNSHTQRPSSMASVETVEVIDRLGPRMWRSTRTHSCAVRFLLARRKARKPNETAGSSSRSLLCARVRGAAARTSMFVRARSSGEPYTKLRHFQSDRRCDLLCAQKRDVKRCTRYLARCKRSSDANAMTCVDVMPIESKSHEAVAVVVRIEGTGESVVGSRQNHDRITQSRFANAVTLAYIFM